jgi:hypothetical protein
MLHPNLSLLFHRHSQDLVQPLGQEHVHWLFQCSPPHRENSGDVPELSVSVPPLAMVPQLLMSHAGGEGVTEEEW